LSDESGEKERCELGVILEAQAQPKLSLANRHGRNMNSRSCRDVSLQEGESEPRDLFGDSSRMSGDRREYSERFRQVFSRGRPEQERGLPINLVHRIVPLHC